MPFILHTPESLIPRSDSKSAATTCKGITSGGRPCRRELKTQKPNDGILAVVSNKDADGEGAAAFFCWQHKDQAAGLAPPNPATGAAGLYPLNKRTSTDTLMERLGFLNVNNEQPGKRKKRVVSRPAPKEGLPQKWQDVPGSLLAVSTSEKPPSQPRPRQRRPHPLLAFLCCGGYEADNTHQYATPIPRRHETSSAPEIRKTVVAPRPQQAMHSSHKDHRRRSSSARPALADKSTNSRNRPSLPRDLSSQTENLLALIPKTLSPQITSQLLAELAKPVSPHDEEGYIYMFWLTPTGTGSSQPKDASTLLSATPTPSPRGRRASSTAAQTSIGQSGGAQKGAQMILLKIGRASNVQRRMNEWTRQCGYDLSLVRFYPYIPSSPLPSPMPSPSSRKTSSLPPTPLSPGAAPRKVPHAHKVERLIHLELAEKRVKRDCEACGKEHREWFEVRGDREGVNGVDEVIRRWVAWGEGR
ncbi:MAG: hypothetical protein Q9166_005395 [cf. Caloplaca sp. 2 TL-2023]